MIVNSKQMQGVPVRTSAGQSVGKLLSVDFDADTGRLVAIRVKISGVVPAMLGQEALVAWAQIVSMSEKEVVISDGFVVEREGWLEKSLAVPPAHVAMRDNSTNDA